MHLPYILLSLNLVITNAVFILALLSPITSLQVNVFLTVLDISKKCIKVPHYECSSLVSDVC